MAEHGGDIDAAISLYGRKDGEKESDWIDLSTGINRAPYPIPPIPMKAWALLPTQKDLNFLRAAAQKAFRAYGAGAAITPLAGAQAAIQLTPRLKKTPGLARVLAPTYNEHAAVLRAAGWRVQEVADFEGLAGADLAVVVNPNNPDGKFYAPERLLTLSRMVGRLIVDESFIDPTPKLSLAAFDLPREICVLRSFGKFYGLAGVRLGFAIGHEDVISQLADLAGPWPVSGAAVEIGARALADVDWSQATIARLEKDCARLDALAKTAGWRLVGGTALFRLFETIDARKTQAQLAQGRIWSRVFPYSKTWLRLGIPGTEEEWRRLASTSCAPLASSRGGSPKMSPP